MTMTIEPDVKRLKKISKMWNKGETQAQIARNMKISRQRVFQMLKQCQRNSIEVISFEKWQELRHKKWFGLD